MGNEYRNNRQLPRITIHKVVGIYAVASTAWLLLTVLLVELLGIDSSTDLQQAYAGSAVIYIFASWLLVYLLIRRFEKPLIGSIKRFRDLAIASSDWSWEMDEQFRFTFLSDRHHELTGVRAEKLLGRTRWELAGDNEPEKWARHRETMEQHLPFRDLVYQTSVVDQDGKGHFFKISGLPVFDEAGHFSGYRGTGSDITEQMEAEMAHQESQRMLSTLMSNLPGMAYRGGNDREWHLEFASSGTEKLTGYQPHELIKDGSITLGDLIIEEDREAVWRGVQGALSENRPYQLSYRIRTATGEEKWVWEQGRGVYSDDGELLAIEGFITDVSEAKYAEEELQHMRQYLSNIIDSMPSVLVGVDQKGAITDWNMHAREETGLTVEQARGQFFGDVFPHLDSQLEKMMWAIAERQPMKTEHLITHSDNEPRYSDVMVYPLIANGAMGAVIRIDDVTARVRLEEMMVQSEKMLSVGGLAAGMAHEINNPLGAVLQGCQNIGRRLSPDLPKNRQVAEELGVDLELINRYMQTRGILEFIEGIREAGNRAANIVTDMLTFSRRSESSFAPADLHELMETSIRLATSDYDLMKKYDFKQVEIERDYAGDIGQVRCDKTEIEQVVLNLLKNAAHAMSAQVSEAPDRIILRTRGEGDYVCIEIIDNGPGMDENTRKRIFEPFFTTKEVGVGTGLGLSVSYFIITDQHKGTMTVESSPGQGARFIIRLPR